MIDTCTPYRVCEIWLTRFYHREIAIGSDSGLININRRQQRIRLICTNVFRVINSSGPRRGGDPSLAPNGLSCEFLMSYFQERLGRRGQVLRSEKMTRETNVLSPYFFPPIEFRVKSERANKKAVDGPPLICAARDSAIWIIALAFFAVCMCATDQSHFACSDFVSCNLVCLCLNVVNNADSAWR